MTNDYELLLISLAFISCEGVNRVCLHPHCAGGAGIDEEELSLTAGS